ncbi:hypothetical protein ACRYCC_42895 [Actinomadura scrupuli]|uniref:hypothetical protein n=1 Tax=Actinomadura scrupuli TaxID=559629 RepID=UPI003D983AA5
MNVEREKQAAAQAAAEFTEDGMAVGLGTGSTVAEAVVVGHGRPRAPRDKLGPSGADGLRARQGFE